MTAADCTRVAEIRVGGWRSAYRGLVPQSYLDAMSVPEDAERHRARLLAPAPGVLQLVAEQDGETVGWLCHGPCRDGQVPPGSVELYALYVDPLRFGAGTGQALVGESIRRCSAAGHTRMYLWVLRDNTRARRFYEQSGFAADGTEEPYEVDGVEVPEVRYVRQLTD
jgi:GNAT superfamily N-acetyltransferase